MFFMVTEPIGDPYLRSMLLSKMDNKHSPKSMLKMGPSRVCKACNKKRAGFLPENDLIKVFFSMKIFFLFYGPVVCVNCYLLQEEASRRGSSDTLIYGYSIMSLEVI